MAETALLLAAFDYIGIGDDNTAANVDQTDLVSPILRKQGIPSRITTTKTNDTWKLEVTFTSADGLAGTDAVIEVGAFDAAAAGNMIARALLDGVKNCDWDAGDSLKITGTCQVKQGA